jgi:GNAT superfamily N-acetyltransferase
MVYETRIDNLLFSNNKDLLQVDIIHHYLSVESYWAQGIPLDLVKESIEGSVCFAVYKDKKQIAYARIVTDNATFGYLADVFVLEEYRGEGISKQLMKFIMDYPPCKKFRRMMLATKDAQGLYAKFGFKNLAYPERIMEIKAFENYKKK